MFKNFLNKLRTKEGIILAIFTLIEIALWIPILIFDAKTHICSSLKISAVVLFPVVAFLLKRNEIFILGLIFTIGSDTFMSYLRTHGTPFDDTIPGMSLFIGVQIVFAIYFFCTSKNRRQQKIITIIRIALSIAFGLIAIPIAKALGGEQTKVYIMMIYLPNIILNAVCAGLNKNFGLMAAFIVYIVSDLFVGIGNLGVSLPFSFSWLLYIPANIMLIMFENTGSYFFHSKTEKIETK